MLFPAFQLQLEVSLWRGLRITAHADWSIAARACQLQERIMGTKFWRRQTKKRATAGAFQGGLDAFQAFMQQVQEDGFRELTESGKVGVVGHIVLKARRMAPAGRSRCVVWLSLKNLASLTTKRRKNRSRCGCRGLGAY